MILADNNKDAKARFQIHYDFITCQSLSLIVTPSLLNQFLSYSRSLTEIE